MISYQDIPQNALQLNWRFDNGVDWLDAFVDQTSLHPGEEVTVTLYQRIPSAIYSTRAIFIHIVNSAGVIIAQRDSYIGSGYLNIQQESDIVADSYSIFIPVTVPAPDEWRIQVGMYDPATGQRSQANDGTGQVLGSELSLATFAATPATSEAWQMDFDGLIKLDKVNLNQNTVSRDGTLTFTLHWCCRPGSPTDLSVHVRALGDQGYIGAITDNPLDTTHPMEIKLQFDPQTPPGVYKLELSVYHATHQSRLEVFDHNGQDIGDRIFLGPVRSVKTIRVAYRLSGYSPATVSNLFHQSRFIRCPA